MRGLTRYALVVLALVFVPGCGDDNVGQPTVLGGGGAKKKKKKKKAEPAAQQAAASADGGVDAAPEVSGDEYNDDNFVELDVQNRDPFRSFARQFKVQAAAPAQRTVVMGDASVDEMRLVAIITGSNNPRAMLTDPSGVGHVIKRGDFIGRPEIVQTGGSEGIPVALNWRVDRIREGALVLTREDPTAPDRAPLTRVMPLHDDEQATR